jgi:hypothetical protein
MSGINRINSGSTLPLSTNFSVGRQSPDVSFGKRVQAGIQATGSIVGSGLGIAGSSFAGGPAILSAAVSSASVLGNQHASGAVNTTYSNRVNYSTGPSGTIGSSGSGGSSAGGSGVNVPSAAAGTSSSDSSVAAGTSSVEEMRRENTELLGIQVQLQRENQLFSSISNSLKTRHDTAKNSIANMR